MPKTPPSFLRRSPRRYTPPGLSPGNSPQQRLYTDTVKVMADDRTENVRRRLDIASKEVDDTAMIDLVADDLSKAYTFLKSQIRSVLCGIGRKWNRRGTGNKKEFLYRNILFLLDGKKAGRNIALMLQDNDACPSFDAFQAKSEETSLSYETCPSRNAIKEHFRSIGDPDEVSTLSGVCLFVMLRDDHVCKQSLMRLTQELKRADFEVVRTRDSFWKDIEKRFNDNSLSYFHSFEGSIPGVNSTAPPLCYRTVDVLKTQLQNGRKSFTLVYSNYSKSGQNDPDKWPDFLTRDRNGEFVAASKRCYIIFLVCRLDQECGQDMLLLNATTKTFEGGGDEGPEDESSTGSVGTKRKRTSAGAFNSTMEKRWSGLERFMDDTRKVGEAIQKSVSTQQTGMSNDFEDLAERNKVLTMISSAYTAYHDAKQRGTDPKLVAFLLENYETAMKKYLDIRERSGSSHGSH